MSGVQFRPYDQAVAANPYPTYARLREQSPIFYSTEYGLTFFFKYRDITKLLADKRLGRSMDHIMAPDEIAQRRRAERWDQLPNYSRFVRVNLLETEGADHFRLRRLLTKALNPRRIRGLRARIQHSVDELMDAVAPRGRMDLLEDLAAPMAVNTIADLLGWPRAERHRLRPWSADIVRLYEKDHGRDEESRAEHATKEFSAMLSRLVDRRRSDPDDDLISAFVSVEDEGRRLGADQLIATCMLLLNAGHEATVNAAGNGLLALLRHPGQIAQLQRDLSLVNSAVEEVLRYDSPLQFFHRYVLEDMQYGDVTFRKGDKIGFLYGSANRDPEAFDEPDEFDICREPNRHLAFGAGAHFCLGALLARLELEILFSTLLRRLPGIRLVDEQPEYRTGLVFRGLKRLRVEW